MANSLDRLDVVPETSVVGQVGGVALQLALDPVHGRLIVCDPSEFWARHSTSLSRNGVYIPLISEVYGLVRPVAPFLCPPNHTSRP